MSVQTTTDAIWTHLSSDLRRFIRRRVSDDHVTDDLLQETFIRIHRHLQTLQEGDRLAAWVYQIARNVVHDHYRKSIKDTVTLDNSENVSDDESTATGMNNSWLNEMILTLADGYREAVQLAEIEGLSQQEVADRLGLSLSGAKSRIQRGRLMLKQVLEQCCFFEKDSRGKILSCDPKPHQKVCQDCRE